MAFLFLETSLAQANPDFQKIKIKVGSKILQVELADNHEKLQHGMMFRKKIGINEGMLFIFPREQKLSFWMKNTFVNLSIGFFSRDRVLLQTLEMVAVSSEMQTNLPVYESSNPAQYALEMRRGWFKENHIKVGDKLELFIKK
jgi:uncharacterized membrane protein (UPF0127 family)